MSFDWAVTFKSGVIADLGLNLKLQNVIPLVSVVHRRLKVVAFDATFMVLLWYGVE